MGLSGGRELLCKCLTHDGRPTATNPHLHVPLPPNDDRLSRIRIAAKSVRLKWADQKPPFSASVDIFQAKRAFGVKATSREELPTFQLPFMWDKAQICVKGTGHIRDGTIRRGEDEGWRCWRRVLRIRRPILPLPDSDGANSSTKDRQAGGRPGSYLCFLEGGGVLPCPFLPGSADLPPPCHSFLFLILQSRLIVQDMTQRGSVCSYHLVVDQWLPRNEGNTVEITEIGKHKFIWKHCIKVMVEHLNRCNTYNISNMSINVRWTDAMI